MINFSDIRTELGEYFDTEGNNLFSKRRDENDPVNSLGAGVDPNKDPYLTFKCISMNSVGVDSVLNPDNDGKAEIVGNREFVYRIDYFGSDAVMNLEHLYTLTQTIKYIEKFRAVNLVIVNMVNLLDTTQKVNLRYEERATSDWLCRTGSVIIDEDIGLIETVKIGGTLKIDDTVNRNLQITINE